MTSTSFLNWFGIVGGLGGLAALVKVFVDRTKVRTDAVNQIADTSVELLSPMRDEISRLRASLQAAEASLDELRRQMRVMAEQGDEAEQVKTRLRTAGQTVDTLRTQIRGLYDELADKDRLLAERDRLIADLRAGRQPS